MATQYSHPMQNVTTTEELANAFQNTYDLDAQNHGETVTVPHEVNWSAQEIIELVEATPFMVLCYDDDESTIIEE